MRALGADVAAIEKEAGNLLLHAETPVIHHWHAHLRIPGKERSGGWIQHGGIHGVSGEAGGKRDVRVDLVRRVGVADAERWIRGRARGSSLGKGVGIEKAGAGTDGGTAERLI